MRPARIVLAGNTGWGMFNFRRGLIERLRQAGHEVIVVSPPDDYTDRLAQVADSCQGVNIDRRGTRPDRDLRTLASFLRTYAMIRPDLVLNYTIKPAVYGTMAARLLGIPNFAMITGLGSGFLGGSLLKRAVSALYRSALKGADGVYFLNQDDRDYFVEHGILPAQRARTLPGEGVDLDRFPASPLPDTREGLRLLYCGRLIRDKGIYELIEAMDLAREAGARVSLDLVGFRDTGNPSVVSEAELSAWQERPYVRFHGRSDHVAEHIARAHCVVLPSYWEGMPRTLMEAGAMARPTLATDVPGCRDIVQDGVTGLLCPARDAPALARSIQRLSAMSPDDLWQMGQAGRKLVADRFSDDVVWAQLEPQVAAALKRASGRVRAAR